jgi:glycosyltransferase involved in cell wall biosynthesis
MVANGVDTEIFRPDPSVQRRPREILCVGRAGDPNKGIKTLIEALARLPQEVRLTLVDEDSPENVGRKRAVQLGCNDRLDIVGRLPIEELIRRYQRAGIVVVPSRYEGFGLPAVEAMACGTPVVACRSGALPEVMATGGGGIVVDRDDPIALANGLRRLLDDSTLREELGARGRERVAAAYAWPRIAAATADAYVEILAARGRPARTTTSDSAGARRAIQSSPASVA